LEDSATAVGSVSIWAGDWNGVPISEMGWMVLPAYQGQGLAKQACRALLDKARTDTRWGVIHAFPGVTNLPSNGICRTLGFIMLKPCDIDYADRILRVNHWQIDLNGSSSLNSR
jgi:RimJ/RimL family protein N-acetyltransferase